MNYKVKIQDVDVIDEIPNTWSRSEIIDLLELYEMGTAVEGSAEELRELLYLAITEFQPQEAAAMLLKFKLGDDFSDGQIEQISNDMLKENVAEHYSDISYHSRFFDINNLLYKAFNGKFPHAKATVIIATIETATDEPEPLDAALFLRCIAPLIDGHALFKRLFENQISGEEPFDDASNIAWYLEETGKNTYKMTTSDYWIANADFVTMEMDVVVDI